MQSIAHYVNLTFSSLVSFGKMGTYKQFACCLLCLTPLLSISCQRNSGSMPDQSTESSSYIGTWEAVGAGMFGVEKEEYRIQLQLRSDNQCSVKITQITKVEDLILIPVTETANLTGTWHVSGQTMSTTFTVVDGNAYYPPGTPGGGSKGRTKDWEFEKYEIKAEWNIADGKFEHKGLFFEVYDKTPDESSMPKLRLALPKFTRKI